LGFHVSNNRVVFVLLVHAFLDLLLLQLLQRLELLGDLPEFIGVGHLEGQSVDLLEQLLQLLLQ